MEPEKTVNPVVQLDPACLKAAGIFAKELGFGMEFSVPQNWGYFPLPQMERLTWLRVAGEDEAGRLNLFDLCQTLERTPREIWHGPLISMVSTARAEAGITPWSDLTATMAIYAKIIAAWRLMVQV